MFVSFLLLFGLHKVFHLLDTDSTAAPLPLTVHQPDAARAAVTEAQVAAHRARQEAAVARERDSEVAAHKTLAAHVDEKPSPRDVAASFPPSDLASESMHSEQYSGVQTGTNRGNPWLTENSG